MNYYIEGDAAKAQQIKAAFEKLGIRASGYDFSRKDVLFFTFEAKGKSYMMSAVMGTGLDNIILTHPDYKELELPVEPKFKVGDRIRWINHDVQNQTITDIKDDSYITVDKYGIKCALKFIKQDEWELVQPKPHYDIANFQPFDKVLVRCRDGWNWECNLFSRYDHRLQNPFITCNSSYPQCIPFEGNEHLLGTNDMPSEEYINW